MSALMPLDIVGINPWLKFRNGCLRRALLERLLRNLPKRFEFRPGTATTSIIHATIGARVGARRWHPKISAKNWFDCR